MQAPIGVHADVGLSPVQLMTGQQHRWWDATLSGSFEHVDRNRDAWGAAVAAGPVLHPFGVDPTGTVSLRLLPQLVGRWTTEGYALDARVEVERSDFADGLYDRKNAGCLARGEVAIGAYVEAGRQLGELPGWSVTLGLVARLPAAIGLTEVNLH